MPFVRSKEDAEFVMKQCPTTDCQELREGWNIRFGQQDMAWLTGFISGMYAERDRAEKERGKGAGA